MPDFPAMADTPWLEDACSLVDAFRAGERSPVEELEACLAAIDASELNAFCHVDPEWARKVAADADVSLPFGGVPYAIKQLDWVKGWPATEASLVFKDQVATFTHTHVERELAAGLVPVGQTIASEFGGLNVSVSRLNGVTGNAWDRTKTAGGSSGGSATAVVGGLVPIATGGDGGGSIRIPAGFCGLLGLKGTAGRIPRGPHTGISPLTVVLGCLARSVRDAARWFDVTNGFDSRDPYSLPRVEGWESAATTWRARRR
jgi:aspartyl-tRNA(Asn)/glutamyl-tRNA(Gln) amidotransferase subunit A